MAVASACSFAEVKINGFSNFTMGRTVERGDDIRGYDHRMGYIEESLYGLQFTKVVDDKLSSTVQFLGSVAEAGIQILNGLMQNTN